MNRSNRPEALERFLQTDPADAGCTKTVDLLDAYAELIVAGENPEDRYPGIAAHLRSCLPCADDLDGLVAAVRADDAEK